MWETRATAKELHKYYVGKEHFDVEIAFFRGLSIKIISGGIKDKHNDSLETSVSRKDDTKYIAWVHSDFRKAIGYKNNFKTIEDVYNAYASFDNVVCVSQEAMIGFKEVIGDTNNLTTIYNMLPIENIKRKSEQLPEVSVHRAKLHLVLVGRLLDSAKGQKRLIDVVSRLHEEGYDISLALIGGGGDEQMLKNEIAVKKASSYITMTGNQMNPYPYIREADLLVCASYFEGYNLTVAEALILETPVLSTRCTGPCEILGNGKYGMIVDNSEKGIYNGLKQFVEEPDLLRFYKNKSSQRINFFDEKKILKQITNLF
jgi:glycosyltransferase involved in cell wall biosynthesis